MTDNAPNEIVELCAFRIGADEYVVDIRRIREIVNPMAIRPVPRAPECIDGVVELRGEVIPVVDARRRLGVAVTPFTRQTRFLIALVGGRTLALIVDGVCEVMRVSRSSIRPAPGLTRLDGPRLFLGACGGEVGASVPAGRRFTDRAGAIGKLRLLLNVRALLEPLGVEDIAAARRHAGDWTASRTPPEEAP
jgi:purine-binding chemotaxis protein CheW